MYKLYYFQKNMMGAFQKICGEKIWQKKVRKTLMKQKLVANMKHLLFKLIVTLTLRVCKKQKETWRWNVSDDYNITGKHGGAARVQCILNTRQSNSQSSENRFSQFKYLWCSFFDTEPFNQKELVLFWAPLVKLTEKN